MICHAVNAGLDIFFKKKLVFKVMRPPPHRIEANDYICT